MLSPMRPSVFLLPLVTLLALPSPPLRGEPIFQLDKGQGEAALRLIRAGDTVRLFCKPCSDVVYAPVRVEARELRPIADRYRLLVNGEPLDVTLVFVDSGYGDGWENLADLLGFVDEAGVGRELPAAVDDVARLRPHVGDWAGSLGGDEVRLELTLAERRLTGSYERVDGRSFQLLATSYNATRRGETLILVERDAGGGVTATLRGELDAEAGTFTGTRTPLDGSPPQLFRLVRTSG